MYKKSTFVLLSSLIWKRTAPSPNKEALTFKKNGCFVLGIVSSVSDVREDFNLVNKSSCSEVQFRVLKIVKKFEIDV